jgi:hypothetical protein
MGRRRPVDFVGWRLYRRALLVPVLALLVLLATSFRAEAPMQAALPPTLANEQAASLLGDSHDFSELFPDRHPNSAGASDSAHWMLDEFRQIPELRAKTVPSTTLDPATGKSVSLVNVEATLPGRTRELVVIHAHRDTAADGRGSDAVGQIALLSLARELQATRDRRRSYMFVSTDGATLNGGGARVLARRLARRGGVVAIIGIDRLGAGATLHVDAAPSGRHAPPLGLVQAATGSVEAEGGDPSVGGVFSQVARLASPVTLREHGQLLMEGLPALTITAGDDQLSANGDHRAEPAQVGAGLRAVQRLVGTIDQVDQLQSAGKTWVASDRRVYRGWALKIFVAAMLIPIWVGSVDMLVRHRRGWNLAAAVGSNARAMLAGMTGIAALWVLGGIGLFPDSGDRPPNPGTLDDVHVFALIVWALITVGAWLVARGPDWRRQKRRARSVAGPDTPELVVGLVALVVLSVLALAVSPYTVLFAVPALHVWICMASWRVIFSRTRVIAVWTVGLAGPLLALVAIGARSDTGVGTGWFALQLLQTRTIPPMLALIGGAAGGVAGLMLVAALGKVASPALPVLRARWIALRDGHLTAVDLLPRGAQGLLQDLARQAMRLRVPSRSSAAGRRGVARDARATPGQELDASARARLRAEARAANRRRVNSR